MIICWLQIPSLERKMTEEKVLGRGGRSTNERLQVSGSPP